MRPIDADKIVLHYDGLAKISPRDFNGIAKYFYDQIQRSPTIEVPVLKSIKDEIPKDHQKVLCLCQGGIYEVLKWDPEIDAWVYTFGRTDDHAYSKSFVLYWMPLPKKEEDHERDHT